ncbi:hypothetical protein E8P82_14905 [Arthrobacter echini]|uniref:Uncharacterized protein n=1 Tax=Arthrobacter echini TaxID=1529066 RepID=A0A4S5DYH3_9MICC|nr:hypothetical protein [Arthrobacter echini]THJ64017.1 hypothetical protein E8P82_14905 [Arthrobacter echini]
MPTQELCRTIERKHRDKLEQFKRAFMLDENVFDEDRPFGEYRPLNSGPFRSVSDKFAELTFGADRTVLSYIEEKPGLAGYKVTLSMAGHHRVMGTRVPLSVEETDAWLYAILGNEWAAHSYHGGAMTGVNENGGRGGLTTVYYMLFLTEDLQPMPRPDIPLGYDLVPVQPDTFTGG